MSGGDKVAAFRKLIAQRGKGDRKDAPSAELPVAAQDRQGVQGADEGLSLRRLLRADASTDRRRSRCRKLARQADNGLACEATGLGDPVWRPGRGLGDEVIEVRAGAA